MENAPTRLLRQFHIDLVVANEGGEHQNHYISVQMDNGWRYTYRVSPQFRRYCFQQIIHGGMKAVEKLLTDGDIQLVYKGIEETTSKLSKYNAKRKDT